jgi:hypothetical protein
VLEGEALQKQVERWVAYGTIEPSAGEAILAVMRTGEWRDLRYMDVLSSLPTDLVTACVVCASQI